MIRGTFAHSKMDNKMTPSKGPITVHIPSGEEMRVFEACCRYNPGYRQGLIDTPLVVIAGKDFGKGANREWAAKGPWLMGIRVILAESFHPNYERSLIQVGILPLRFPPGQNAKDWHLSGREAFSFLFEECAGNGAGDGVSVEMRVDDGRRFRVFSSFRSEAALHRVAAGGFFGRAMDNFMVTPRT